MAASPPSCPRCAQELPDGSNFCPGCGADVRRRKRRAPRAGASGLAGTGRVVGGSYRLLERLGEGGMGAVWRAEHVRMGKVLALKLLRPDVAVDPRRRERFQEEARLVSQLSHPNTIQVFDSGELEDGGLYLAMEYLPGRDLAWTLREEGPLPEAEVLAVASQVLASLAEAHELGIIHRDIKPANVMRVRGRGGEERVKVLDFGIAKLAEPGRARKPITGTADVVGTPAYMSPEQVRGEPLDARSDLYSVGALLFELATGKPVYRGPTAMSVAAQHMDGAVPPPRPSDAAPERDFSQGFEALLQRALAKRPRDRFPSADAMREAVEALRRGGGTRAPGGPAMEASEWGDPDVARREDFDRFARRLRRRRVLRPVLALAGVAGAAAAAFVLWQHEHLEEPASAARWEREPNDTPAQAHLLGPGQPVRGRMGAPRTTGTSDRDVYRLDGVRGALTVELSGVPDLNLLVEVAELERGPDGAERLRRLLVLDDAPVGGAERVDGLLPAGGTFFLRVEERAHALSPPRPVRESSLAEYTLVVRPSAPRDVAASEGASSGGPIGELTAEVEPNDSPRAATRVGTGRAVRGWTGAWVGFPLDPRLPEPSAADLFLALPPGASPGRLAAVVVPPPGVDLWLEDAQAPRGAASPDLLPPVPLTLPQHPAALAAQAAASPGPRAPASPAPEPADAVTAATERGRGGTPSGASATPEPAPAGAPSSVSELSGALDAGRQGPLAGAEEGGAAIGVTPPGALAPPALGTPPPHLVALPDAGTTAPEPPAERATGAEPARPATTAGHGTPARGEEAVPSGPVHTGGRPAVLWLTAGPLGHVLRLLPASPDVTPGAEYRLAFFYAGEGGMEGVEALARALDAEGRTAERDAVRAQVAQALHPAGPAVGDAAAEGRTVTGGAVDGGAAPGGVVEGVAVEGAVDGGPGNSGAVDGGVVEGSTSAVGGTDAGDTAAGDTPAGDTAAGDTAAGDTAAGDTAAGDTAVPRSGPTRAPDTQAPVPGAPPGAAPRG